MVYLPLWKIWKSVGMMKFPIYGNMKKNPTHQPVYNIYYYYYFYYYYCYYDYYYYNIYIYSNSWPWHIWKERQIISPDGMETHEPYSHHHLPPLRNRVFAKIIKKGIVFNNNGGDGHVYPAKMILKYMAVCQNVVPLVNIKIAGKWMFIPLKMVLIGIDPYPYEIIKNMQFIHVQPIFEWYLIYIHWSLYESLGLPMVSRPSWRRPLFMWDMSVVRFRFGQWEHVASTDGSCTLW